MTPTTLPTKFLLLAALLSSAPAHAITTGVGGPSVLPVDGNGNVVFPPGFPFNFPAPSTPVAGGQTGSASGAGNSPLVPGPGSVVVVSPGPTETATTVPVPGEVGSESGSVDPNVWNLPFLHLSHLPLDLLDHHIPEHSRTNIPLFLTQCPRTLLSTSIITHLIPTLVPTVITITATATFRSLQTLTASLCAPLLSSAPALPPFPIPTPESGLTTLQTSKSLVAPSPTSPRISAEPGPTSTAFPAADSPVYLPPAVYVPPAGYGGRGNVGGVRGGRGGGNGGGVPPFSLPFSGLGRPGGG